MTRRLAAIMFTDIVGFTASAQADEATALKLLREQEKLVRPLLAAHHGRRVKSTGDGLLLEFENALDAVECSAELQHRLHERNTQEGVGPLRIRVGIHLGDVQRRGTDIFGDAVNIAARIEPLAEPGGVCLSAQVFDQVHNKVPYKLTGLGPKALKGIQGPIAVYRVGFPWTKSEPSPAPLSPLRLAILPLANISPDPRDEYFADGLTEELISGLAKIGGLSVISRTSVMQYKEHARSLPDIGRELGCGSLIEGSVRKSGNRIRVTIQMVDATRDEHLWSETYDRDLEDVFAIQSDIAQRVADALKVRLLARERSDIERTPTESIAAYELCLKGRSQRSRENRDGLTQALQNFQEALARDPNCVPALVGLSNCYHDGSHSNFFSPEEAYPSMKRSASRALEIDPRSADAHAALGAVYFHYEWNWKEAERELRTAIRLQPSSPGFYETLSFLLATLGRSAESYEMARRCLDLSPQLPTVSTWAQAGTARMGVVLFSGTPVDRQEYLANLARSNPENARVQEALGYALLRGHRPEEAISRLKRAVRLSKGESLYRADLGLALAWSGRAKEARSILSQLKRRSRTAHVSLVQWALLLESLGRRDAAFAKLEEAYERRSIDLGNVRLVPEMAQLRADPRWKSIERRMGLPQL